MNCNVLLWEAIGAILIIIVGSLLHFTYEWSGYNPIVGIFSAVNESQWEHFKMGIWPYFFFALIEYYFLKDCVSNFWVAKMIGIYAIPILIYIMFNLYTEILGKHVLAIDIGIFIVSIIAAQLISFAIITSDIVLPEALEGLAIALIGLLLISLVVFTFFPPRLEIFRDSTNKTYGAFKHRRKKTSYL